MQGWERVIYTLSVRCATRARRVTRTGSYGPGGASLSGCIGLHLILYSIQKTAKDRRWAMSHSNTPPVRNRAPQTARSRSLRCVSAADHHTAEQYSKTSRTKPRKHLSRSDLSWNTRQDILKIPSIWAAALETKHSLPVTNIFYRWRPLSSNLSTK